MFERIFGNDIVFANFSTFIAMLMVFTFLMSIVIGIIIDNSWNAAAQMHCQESGFVWDNDHATCTNMELIPRGS